MLLKELHTEIAGPVLTHIFQISLKTGNVTYDWKHMQSLPLFRKAQNVSLVTTGLYY
jgi:hypothetical protein